MPLQPIEQVEFGGVDSRSNPLNMPPNRLLRCLNWVPKQAGYMELRWGYSAVAMNPVTAGAFTCPPIPFTKWDGTQQVLLFQGFTWTTFTPLTTVVSTPTVRGAGLQSLANGGRYFVFNNRVHVGNGSIQKFFDGSTWRDSGIRAPLFAEYSSITVTQGATDTSNGLPIASLTGFQHWMAYYNPTTGHVGNAVAVGARLANNNTCDVSFSTLPDLSGVDTELLKVFGRTGDGAQVAYVLTDTAGNWLTAGNTATSATLAGGTIDGNFALPTRNGIIPAAETMFAVIGDYIYAADPGSPTIRVSGSALDSRNGKFMGRPEQSWAANDIETFPTAQAVMALTEVDLEAFVATPTDCAILTDLAGVRSWRGPWPVGIAGPAAYAKTHHGFFWVSADKELCTFINGLPTPVSEEYEAAELSQIGDSFIQTVHLAYFRNKALNKDELRIECNKQDGTTYTIIHDFKLMDQRSPFGQGYASAFAGQLANNYKVAQVRDGTSKLQVYACGTNGQIYQLYSGSDDAGTQFTADGIGLVNCGPDRPSVPYVDWYGDKNLIVSVGKVLKTDLLTDQFTFEVLTPGSDPGISPPSYEDDFRFRATLQAPELRHTYFRFQLSSHSADGSLALNSPVHLPLESYGRIYEFIPILEDEKRGP